MSRSYAERIRLKCPSNYSEFAIINSLMTVWGRGYHSVVFNSRYSGVSPSAYAYRLRILSMSITSIVMQRKSGREVLTLACGCDGDI